MKKQGLIALALLGLATLALVPLAASPDGEPDRGRYSIEMDVGLAADDSGAYEARALVTDLASGEVVSAPRIIFLPGEGARVQSATPDGLYVDIEIDVEEGGGSAAYRAEVRQGEVVLNSQRLTVRLAGGGS